MTAGFHLLIIHVIVFSHIIQDEKNTTLLDTISSHSDIQLILAGFLLLMTSLICSLIFKPDIHPRSTSSSADSFVPRLCHEIEAASNADEITPANEFCFICLAEKNAEIEHCKLCDRCVKHFHLHSRLFN